MDIGKTIREGDAEPLTVPVPTPSTPAPKPRPVKIRP